MPPIESYLAGLYQSGTTYRILFHGTVYILCRLYDRAWQDYTFNVTHRILTRTLEAACGAAAGATYRIVLDRTVYI